MATHPTKGQQRACDGFAEALVLITEGARLDGKGRLERDDLLEIAGRIARASSTFTLDEIVVRALVLRGRALGLPESTGELLTLLDADIRPLEILLLSDEAFRDLVGKLEEELGEV
jgi:hypothetical protein